MPDTAVTHEQLRAGQMALIDRFSSHEKQFHETTTRLFDKLDVAIDASHENKIALTKLDGQLVSMGESRESHIARLASAENAIKSLEAVNNRHDGERGVFAALLRSPFVGWLVAGFAFAWAAIKGAAAHVP